jgi:hypothetical protein
MSRSFTRTATSAPSSDRYGPFGLLDRRSTYGKYLVPRAAADGRSDVDNEIRVDYFHAEKTRPAGGRGRIRTRKKSFGW